VTLVEEITRAHIDVARGEPGAKARLERLQDEYRSSGASITRPGPSVQLVEPEAPVPRAGKNGFSPARPRANQDQQRREIPELRKDATPKVTVKLRPGALAGIIEELNETGDIPLNCLETGGSCFGRLRDGALELLDASGPGSDESPRRFENAVKISIAEAPPTARTPSSRSTNCGGGPGPRPATGPT
jgi:hypothetical protein